MEYFNIYDFIQNFSSKEEAERVEDLQEVNDINALYNSNFNYIDIMEV